MKKPAILLAAFALVALAAYFAWPADVPIEQPRQGNTAVATEPVATTAAQPIERTEVTTQDAVLDAGSEPRVFPAVRERGAAFGTVVDAFGVPVADALVEAMPTLGDAPPGLVIADDRTQVARVSTLADGTFRVAGLAEGPTQLRAQRDDRVATAIAIVNPNREAGPVSLQLGAAPASGDDLRVIVVDQVGQAVADAEVVLFAYSRRTTDAAAQERSRREPLFRGHTAADGKCGLRGLGVGHGVVFATARDGRVGSANTTGERDMKVVVAAAGELRGRLTGLPAERLAGARLGLHSLSTLNPYYVGGGRCLDVELTGSTFVVRGLAAGTYGFTLSAPAAAPHGARLVTTPFHWGREPMANSIEMPSVEIKAGETTDIALAIVAGGCIRGTVGAAGRPVRGARVVAVLAPRTGNFPAGFVLRGAHVWRLDGPYENVPGNPISTVTTRTDGSGAYELSGLAPGNWRVEVAAPALSFDRRMDTAVVDGECVTLRHTLSPAGVLQVALLDATYIGVISEGGRDPVMLAITRSDFVTFPGLAAGRYVVARFHSDANVEPVPVATAEIVAGRTTWLDLRSASARAVIRGQVLAGATPVEGARVGFSRSTATGADGTFQFELGYVPRPRAPFASPLRVHSRGFDWEFKLQGEDFATALDTVLQLGDSAVDVEVTDGGGATSAVLEVHWQKPEATAAANAPESVRGRVVVRNDGKARLGPFPVGRLGGSVRFSDGLEVQLATAVPRPDVLRLVRPASATLTVRVTRDGKPVPRARVSVATWIGEGPAPERAEDFRETIAVANGRTRDDGTVTIAVLAGEATLYAHLDSDFNRQRVPPRRLRIEPGSATTIDFALP